VQELGGFLNRAFSGKLRKQAETAIDAAGLTPAIKAEIQREAAKPLPKPPVYTSAEAQAKLEEFARAHEAKYLYEAESIALNLTSGVPERRRKALRMEQCRLMLLILEKGTAAMAGFNPDVRPSDSPPLPKIENFSPEKRAAIAKASAEERLAILQNEHESSLPAYRQEVAKFHQQLATHTALKQIKAVVLDFVKETFQREDPKQVEGLIEQCITDPATQQLLKATRETK